MLSSYILTPNFLLVPSLHYPKTANPMSTDPVQIKRDVAAGRWIVHSQLYRLTKPSPLLILHVSTSSGINLDHPQSARYVRPSGDDSVLFKRPSHSRFLEESTSWGCCEMETPLCFPRSSQSNVLRVLFGRDLARDGFHWPFHFPPERSSQTGAGTSVLSCMYTPN
jgi:hypothetical protein